MGIVVICFFWCKLCITNVTFEWFLYFMDCWNMSIEIGLYSKLSTTRFTLELFFFPSWIIVICPIKPCFDDNCGLQISHLNCFFPSWTLATCFFKSLFRPKLAVQLSHFIMTCCNVSLHPMFWREFSIINVTFECPFSFMDSSNF